MHNQSLMIVTSLHTGLYHFQCQNDIIHSVNIHCHADMLRHFLHQYNVETLNTIRITVETDEKENCMNIESTVLPALTC